MEAPIFPASTPDGSPKQYMYRARMFQEAARDMPDYKANEQFWPKYALLCHAAELALKAFVRSQSAKGIVLPVQQLHNHDLLGWYHLAVHGGLNHSKDMEAAVSLLGEHHRHSFMRYPEPMPKPASSLISASSEIDNLITMIATAPSL